MLRAGLLGLPSSGKTTLFQLLTSAREAPRTHGKAEANVGMSRVPDERLDRLTALFQPKKRVPATVEFADMAAARAAGTQALLDVVAYRNADALLHVVRAFRDPSVPHAHSSIDPARDARLVEDELILADLGVVERRLERLVKDLKRTPTADLKHEDATLARAKACARGRARAADAVALGRRSAASARVSVSLGQTAADRRSISTKPTSRPLPTRRGRCGLDEFVAATSAAVVGVCAKIELEIAQLDPADAAAFLADLGLASRASIA